MDRSSLSDSDRRRLRLAASAALFCGSAAGWVGSDVGIAYAGGAVMGTWPFALVGAVLGGLLALVLSEP